MLTQHRHKHVDLAVILGALVAVLIAALIVQLAFVSPALNRDKVILDAGASFQALLQKTGSDNPSTQRAILKHVHLVRDGGVVTDLQGVDVAVSPTKSVELTWAANVVNDSIVKGRVAPLNAQFDEFIGISSELYNKTRNFSVWFLVVTGTVVVLLFGLFVSMFFSRLRKVETILNASIRDNRSILDATNDALFFIKPTFSVSSVQSRAVQEVFGITAPIQGNFLDFMRPLLGQEDFESTRDYLSLMLNGQSDQSQIDRLNPLKEVEVSIESSSRFISSKYLKFDFCRNDLNPKAGLFVSVRDVSEEVVLAREIASAKHKNDERFHLLMGSVANDSDDIKAFYRSTHIGFKEINGLLRGDDGEHFNNLQKLKLILTTVQRLKVSAGAAGMPLIETSADEFETKIAELLKRSEVEENQVLDLAMSLKHMISELNFLEQLSARLGRKQTVEKEAQPASKRTQQSEVRASSGQRLSRVPVLTTVQDPTSDRKILAKMPQYAQAVASQHGKSVALNLVGFEDYNFSAKIQKELETICAQLVENSIVHGIEDPEQRLTEGKTSEGHITLKLTGNDDKSLRLTIQDDGAGFDFYAIRKTIVQQNLATIEKVSSMSKSELVHYIFVSGFTTREYAHKDVEHGIGLDLVQDLIGKMGGRISVRSSRGVSSKITIRLPQSVLVQDPQTQPEMLELAEAL